MSKPLQPHELESTRSSVHGISQAGLLELSLPSPGDLPDPGIKLMSPALQAVSLPLNHMWGPYIGKLLNINCEKVIIIVIKMAESEEEPKSLLMKLKEESEKVGLKLHIPKIKIMESRPITSWQIVWETVEAVADSLFLGSKITADGDYSHEIKRHSFLGRKVITNLDGILKSRDITLPTKFCMVKAMVFPVVMYGCENWAIKKAEH